MSSELAQHSSGKLYLAAREGVCDVTHRAPMRSGIADLACGAISEQAMPLPRPPYTDEDLAEAQMVAGFALGVLTIHTDQAGKNARRYLRLPEEAG